MNQKPVELTVEQRAQVRELRSAWLSDRGQALSNVCAALITRSNDRLDAALVELVRLREAQRAEEGKGSLAALAAAISQDGVGNTPPLPLSH